MNAGQFKAVERQETALMLFRVGLRRNTVDSTRGEIRRFSCNIISRGH